MMRRGMTGGDTSRAIGRMTVEVVVRGGRGDGEGMGMKKARAARIGLGRERARDEGRGGAVVGGNDVWSGGARVRRMVRLTIGAVCDDSLVGDARDEEASGDA